MRSSFTSPAIFSIWTEAEVSGAGTADGASARAGVRPGAIEGAESEGDKVPQIEGAIRTVPAAPETDDWAAAPAREAEKVWAKAELGIEAERRTARAADGFMAC